MSAGWPGGQAAGGQEVLGGDAGIALELDLAEDGLLLDAEGDDDLAVRIDAVGGVGGIEAVGFDQAAEVAADFGLVVGVAGAGAQAGADEGLGHRLQALDVDGLDDPALRQTPGCRGRRLGSTGQPAEGPPAGRVPGWTRIPGLPQPGPGAPGTTGTAIMM